ncbi:hypothetical protein ACFQY8_02395 [Alloscardovia venturai]|uniref:Uncharacterized protein n=1 Tax=Alloscardovia venturai TaxID=1769421 RepID=A0ABW2Y3J2_9BIFI
MSEITVRRRQIENQLDLLCDDFHRANRGLDDFSEEARSYLRNLDPRIEIPYFSLFAEIESVRDEMTSYFKQAQYRLQDEIDELDD